MNINYIFTAEQEKALTILSEKAGVIGSTPVEDYAASKISDLLDEHVVKSVFGESTEQTKSLIAAEIDAVAAQLDDKSKAELFAAVKGVTDGLKK